MSYETESVCDSCIGMFKEIHDKTYAWMTTNLTATRDVVQEEDDDDDDDDGNVDQDAIDELERQSEFAVAGLHVG